MTFQPDPTQLLEEIPLIEEDEEGQRRSYLLGAKGEDAGKCATCKKCPPFFLFLCKASLCIKKKREDIEHGSHAVHSLDNIGDRLGLKRVNKPDKSSHEWNPPMSFIPGT